MVSGSIVRTFPFLFFTCIRRFFAVDFDLAATFVFKMFASASEEVNADIMDDLGSNMDAVSTESRCVERCMVANDRHVFRSLTIKWFKIRNVTPVKAKSPKRLHKSQNDYQYRLDTSSTTALQRRLPELKQLVYARYQRHCKLLRYLVLEDCALPKLSTHIVPTANCY